MIMHQCPLHPLLFRTFRHIDRPHGKRVKFRIVHAGRQRTRRRIEVLHLVRYESVFLEKTSQLNRIVETAARMRGNQIRDQILLQPEALVHLSVLLVEGQKNLFARLAHVTEYLRP